MRDFTPGRAAELTGIPTDDIEWYEDFTELKLTCTGLRLNQLTGKFGYEPVALAKRLKVG